MRTEERTTSQERKIAQLSYRLDPSRQVGSPRDEEVSVEGVPISELAKSHGTPLYVYGGGALRTRVAEVQAAVGEAAEIHFSLKANPSLGVCQLIRASGLGAEVASGGELVLAGKAGFPPERTLFAGPGKSDVELMLAAGLGIQAVNVESVGELGRLSAIGQALGRRVKVALRVNPEKALGGAKMRMGGGPRQFGVPEEEVPEVLYHLRRMPGVEGVGVHVYVGTQMFEAEEILAHCRQVIDIALRVSDGLCRPLSLVDLGGGLGVPYFEGTADLILGEFGAGLQSLVAEARKDRRLARARFALELGRFLVAECGMYVVKVLDVKECRGKRFVVVDGGMNHNVMATGNFGQIFRKPYPVARVGSLLASDFNQSPSAPTTVVGPCCTPLDVLGQDLPLPELRVGDLLGVFYSGAYGPSASSLSFLSHPTPAEVLVNDGRVHLLRAGGSFQQVLEGQISIDGEDAEAALAI